MKRPRLSPVLLAALAITPCACHPAVWGWLADKTDTTVTVPAKYTPPPGKAIFVFVDDRFVETDQPLARLLTDRIVRELVARKVATRVIGYREMLDLAAITPAFGLMNDIDIARRLGADIVCRVQVEDFVLQEEAIDTLWQGRLGVTVRMTDVADGRRLWPAGEPRGHAVPPAETPATANTDPAYGAELTRQLADTVAEQVVRLFHKHEVSAWEGV